MGDCILSYKQIVKVVAYADDEISFSAPMEVFQPVIGKRNFTVKVGAGMTLAIANCSAKFKSKRTNDISGGYYTNTLSYDMAPDYKNVGEQITALYYNHYHLLIYCLGGASFLVRSSEYSFVFEDGVESDGTHSCTITITNVSGAQKLI